MKTLHFGEVSVDKVIDGIERFPALNAFPEIDIELFNQNIEKKKGLFCKSPFLLL